MKTPTTGLLAIVCASALLAAGCGSSNKRSTSASAGSAAQAASQQSSTTAAATRSAAKAGITVSVKHSGKLGAILAAGPKHLTVYMFEGDKGASSSCSGGCAAAWPPVTSSGQPSASAGVSSAGLGTITRPDGTMQVTYHGHPLYYFASDKDSGDSYGEGINGFGASWYVLSPSGAKVDKS